MLKLFIVICSSLIVASADTLIKFISLPETTNHLYLWLAVGSLYSFQCYLAYIVFKMGNADLGIYACLFVAFYSILTCLSGNVFFNEVLKTRQYIGIIISLIGAILLSLE